MKQLLVIFLIVTVTSELIAAKVKSTETQTGYERSINAVVRNKYFYKTKKIEIGSTAGVMPYDSVVNHYLVGAKATWHFSDHFGWEVADVQFGMPSITADIKGKVTANSLSNVQFSQINLLATSNLIVSPIYGKIRFFGSQVLYFDIYTVLGVGMANTKTIKLSNSDPKESTVRQGMEPAFDFGLGVKIFTSDALALLIDLRDYVTLTEVYSSRKPRSNFSVFAGLSFFLPTF
ncbi:MAG: outer membrane beta-barrel domain-containing protein [Deltaproteobacteria bacterium]|nr:outer membrane beta-barrel domain-containing protein [Deltaproteobacteria bacterium]MBM4316059.1 outer membrane beta-barrel domain-containing protein [Deltaproteobacteria bacterium]